ncbi:MAG: hypothetical protein N2512_00150 [Armatimonadetes bacterium]|nr:hypothetical protein [Armatimonadota bacterium]
MAHPVARLPEAHPLVVRPLAARLPVVRLLVVRLLVVSSRPPEASRQHGGKAAVTVYL